MNGYLLDTNVLIALLWPSHTSHDLVLAWFGRHRAKRWATCPLTEAAFVRIVSNPAFSRDAVTPREAAGLLAANTGADDHVFWPIDLGIASVLASTGTRLVGHQQVTDGYLVALALKQSGRLVTLDAGVVELTAPRSVERRAVELIASS
ncbi:MAG: PIN domain-containing protein [Cyanobacteria bacterium]|nr:PIN domain-containing protein [Cyanobacteriota bacterium]